MIWNRSWENLRFAVHNELNDVAGFISETLKDHNLNGHLGLLVSCRVCTVSGHWKPTQK